MNISTNKTTLFACTFLCGAVAKTYDDLTDNYRLHKFSNPILLEVLKGTFMLTLTFTSIFNPLWGLMMWMLNFGIMLLEPSSYELPYEKSLYITYGVLFMFINYDKLFEQINELYSSFYEGSATVVFFFLAIITETTIRKTILLPIFPQYVKDNFNIEKEVSLFKITETSYAVLTLVFLLNNIHNISSKLFMSWILGYMGVRLCVQLYSLFVYKPKTFSLDETHIKQKSIKEPEEPKEEEPKEEEPKEEEPKEEEPKEEEPKEEPKNTSETI